ncbi:MAG: hypothetical protein HY274_05325, partial [Gammaproteobacteria bacterium]|nr:hypothetical protein [Gammaproteobacteria bacterium]
MGKDSSADPSLLQSLKHHLEGLKRTEHGLVLYNQIQRGLQKYGHTDGRIELVFVTFLHGLLGKYATSPSCDPATRVKARLIQQRLTLYMPTQPAVPAITTPAPPPAAPAPVEVKPATPSPVVAQAPPTPAPPVAEVKPEPATAREAVAPPPEAPPSTRQDKIEALEDTLAHKVTESIQADQKLGELLESERAALQDTHSPLGELGDLKQILVKGLNELIEERQALIDKLSTASDYLKAVETDRERLRQ